MVSLIPSSTARHLISPLVPSTGLTTNFKISPQISFISVKPFRVLECKELKETRTRSRFSCESCSDSEGELALERELLVFMKNSKNPDEFPSKKQLLDAGRVDLVNAITKKGGWLALGWDCSEDEDGFKTNDIDDVKELQIRVEGFEHRHHRHNVDSASSTGRSLEEDAGVEGILSRLEKHRSLSFDIHMEKNTHASTNNRNNMSTDAAAKIDSQLQERPKHNNHNNDSNKDLESNDIGSRLQQMQLELSTALKSLRSKSWTPDPQVEDNNGSELQQLSDTWEFQENEVIKAEDKLRSIRSKLAVLEGKMALSVMDTQKLVQEKQRRIDSARATLQLLRTTCVFWTHPASEVFLVGSFDGWTSQVKMEKTRTGIFSTSLKLYPGRYEMKFIVDGAWRIDPMLPVVRNNGYENNSLIVRESA